MGRFERLVNTLAMIELFKEKYHIPPEVMVRHCTTEGVEFDRKVGEVVIDRKSTRLNSSHSDSSRMPSSA